ncbi:MAG: hypothetical protein CM1200mP7_3380 [Chloroflexota bacterium]|nr:MAG: hypothetical protein CM1200mP7_3380 [Chloroflexota bacterium]
MAKTIGVDVKFLKPDQVKDIWPLINTEGLVGAIQHPEDGYIQPADLTQALATGQEIMVLKFIETPQSQELNKQKKVG